MMLLFLSSWFYVFFALKQLQDGGFNFGSLRTDHKWVGFQPSPNGSCLWQKVNPTLDLTLWSFHIDMEKSRLASR